MNILLDVFANLSFVIIICIMFMDEKIRDNKYFMSDAAYFIISVLSLSFPILLMTGHGNIFIGILTQFIYSALYVCFLYDSISCNIENKETVNLRECINDFITLVYCIVGIYSIFFRIKLEKEYLINLFNKIKSIHYKEMFLELIKNNWFQGICVGIISTVAGGLILHKIVSSISENKDKSKDKKDN